MTAGVTGFPEDTSRGVRSSRGRAAKAFALAAASIALAWPRACSAGEPERVDPTEALDRAIESGDVLAAFDAMEAVASAAMADALRPEGQTSAGASRAAGAEAALARAFESRSAWLRRAALRTLGAIGGERSTGILLRALEDRDALVRLDACGVAARGAFPAAGGPRILRALSARLFDERRGVRAEAARALGLLAERLAREAKTDAPALEEAAESLARAASRDADPATRAAAVEAVARFAGERAFDVASKALAEDDDRVRESAVRALAISARGRALAALERATKDDSGRVRVTAAAALAHVGTDDAVAALVRTLSLKDEDLRSQATAALGRVGSSRAVEALRALLAHEAGEVRREAAQALGDLGDAASMESLARLASDHRADVRAAAVEALGRLADLRAAGVVRTGLADRDAEVRARAAEAAGRIGDPEALPALLQLIRPGFSDGERVAAATAIGLLGDVRTAEALAALLDDGSEHVRRSAATALAQLGTKGEALLLHEAAFAGAARADFLGALAILRVPLARHFFRQELARSRAGSAERLACEIGLFLLGDAAHRQAVLDGARPRRPGANPALAMAALVLARDPEAEKLASEAIRSADPVARESAALALGVARPSWGEPLLREAASDRDRAVALRARVGLRWYALRGVRG